MRDLILKELKKVHDDHGLIDLDDNDVDDFADVEGLSDEDLLKLYGYIIGFQG